MCFPFKMVEKLLKILSGYFRQCTRVYADKFEFERHYWIFISSWSISDFNQKIHSKVYRGQTKCKKYAYNNTLWKIGCYINFIFRYNNCTSVRALDITKFYHYFHFDVIFWVCNSNMMICHSADRPVI